MVVSPAVSGNLNQDRRAQPVTIRHVLPLALILLATLWVVRDRAFGLWSHSVDLGIHYAKVSRIAERGVTPPAFDPALGQLISFYPRWAHISAAFLGKWTGSSLVGMQVVVLGAVALLWGAVGLGLGTLPRRAMFAAFTLVMTALALNARWLGLEIHGYEIVDNYFFAHLVSQAAVIGFIVGALWLERLGVAAHRTYLFLGAGVLVADNLHFTPAVVLLGLLALLVLADFVALPTGRRRRVTIGLLVVVAATVLTVMDPFFRIMVKIAAENGYLALRYVGNVPTLAKLCVLVAVLSAGTFAFWFRSAGREEGRKWLLFKYVALYGLATALLCGLQIGMLTLGRGSEYACRKYAFALNTALLLELALLPVGLMKRWWRVGPSPAPLAASVLPAVLLIMAVRLILPDAKAGDYRRLRRDERAIFALGQSKDFGPGQGKLDFVVGLGDRTHDYLFNIGWLRQPHYGYNGSIEVLQGKAFSRPELVGRLASREGSPWDVPACRLGPALDSLVVLDGACVATAGAPKK